MIDPFQASIVEVENGFILQLGTPYVAVGTHREESRREVYVSAQAVVQRIAELLGVDLRLPEAPPTTDIPLPSSTDADLVPGRPVL